MKRRIPITLGVIALLYCSPFAQNAGDLIITEYMANPQDVPNDQGEYIEVFNPTTYPVSLYGCVIQDASGLSVSVDQSIWLNPGDFAVLGRAMVPGASFYYPSSPPPFNLNNIGGDQITITCNGVLVAHTAYTSNQQAGQAMSLAGTHLHNNGHTLEAHYGPESYQFQYPGTGTTDYGSPGFAGSTFVLPVSLTHFTATSTEQGILLEWETATEYNNSHFRVERSHNGRDYYSIAEIDGAGDSEAPIRYRYTDASPEAGENYYRLCQFDFDGTHDYSEVRSAIHQPKNVQLYPTLVKQELTVKWPQELSKDSDLMVVDQQGKVLIKEKIPAGMQQHTFNLAALPRGFYCIAAGSLKSSRFLKR